MRDLEADKAMCNAEITETPGVYTIDVEELEKGFYMWRERALRAEADVERLKLMVTSITGGLDEAIETVQFLEAENAKLRKVVDAAHVAVAYLQAQPTIQHILVQALAGLDEATHD